MARKYASTIYYTCNVLILMFCLQSCAGTQDLRVKETEMEVVEVTNPVTGKIWMDRNLGAEKVAGSVDDKQAFGDFYQWGRGMDGHQKRGSGTTRTLSRWGTPSHSKFILTDLSPNDWRKKQNDELWQGEDGVNNPCPSGYRLPTQAEWDSERISWSSNNLRGAFQSPLKLPAAGYREHNSGLIIGDGSIGSYWSSSVVYKNAVFVEIRTDRTLTSDFFRSTGFSVRCIKD